MNQRPRRWMYLIAGALLALGSPLGLLLLQAWLAEQLPTWGWVKAELLAQRPQIYIYLTVSTAVVFAASGWLVGRLHDRLQVVSLTDPLTGLWNRRHFNQCLRYELRRANRYHTPLSLLLVDVDRLKAINDSYGHEAGDDALRQVAQALRASCRSTDVIARYGGDEFAVLAPSTALPAATRLAERIRACLHRTPDGPSVSTGVADFSDTIPCEPQLLRDAADLALRTAKTLGRDRVESVPPRAHASS